MSNQERQTKPDGGASVSTVGLAVTADELRAICDATVRLTELRQRGCAHLCVENVAPEIMRKLLLTLRFHALTGARPQKENETDGS